ncbi:MULTISPECIES: DUF1824 family protein [Cyanophyceae]|uniref:DUF1824 family protein n=1 Tax=Cyanophyceae TaxID=3028117 RepID=UPI00016DC938|nr:MULTISPECIES: DUF1824 family protein [Cyanophyceae]ACA99532.1 conserved hypothetical protein [Picosynechococcus sp. PCC 7002]SMH30078.1 protein of unknown function [Picosynechococcus sp. OG1]SMQ83816.1 protein of unknown function [Synechococcus sp. 7002]
MSISPELAAAIAFLQQKSCVTTPVQESEAERETLRQKLRLACQAANWENIGICADNVAVATATVQQYLRGLGYDSAIAIDPGEWGDRPVYLKFNTQKMSHYLDDYVGQYRGVLVALQSPEPELAGTYGHFPLDLFAG